MSEILQGGTQLLKNWRWILAQIFWRSSCVCIYGHSYSVQGNGRVCTHTQTNSWAVFVHRYMSFLCSVTLTSYAMQLHTYGLLFWKYDPFRHEWKAYFLLMDFYIKSSVAFGCCLIHVALWKSSVHKMDTRKQREYSTMETHPLNGWHIGR